jgi:hypothetical protein
MGMPDFLKKDLAVLFYAPAAASLGAAGTGRRSPTCWRHMA